MSIGAPIGSAIGSAIGSGMAGGGGSAWSPLSLFAAGEKGVWFDPSDFSSMFQDSAGTTPVTAVGQTVGRINDKSGNAKHATQASPKSRPLLQQDGSGFYYLDFDGTDDSLATAAINFTATDKMTVCTGFKHSGETGARFLVCGAIAGNGRFDIYTSYTTTLVSDLVFSTINAKSIAITSNAAVLTARYDFAGATHALQHSLRLNAAAATSSGTTAAAAGNFASQAVTLGALTPGTSNYLSGRIYQLVVRGAATASLTELENYVNSKTGAY